MTQLDRPVVHLEATAAALLEEALAQARERGGRRGRGERRERRVRSSRPRSRPAWPAGRGRRRAAATAAAPGAARARAGPRRARPRTRPRRVELEVVRDHHLRALEPPRVLEPLARRGEERDGVGGPALERAVEVAVEALQRSEPPRVVGPGGAAATRAARRSAIDPAAAQRGRAFARGRRPPARAASPRGGAGRRRPLSARSREASSASWPLVHGRRPRPRRTGSASARASSSGFIA